MNTSVTLLQTSRWPRTARLLLVMTLVLVGGPLVSEPARASHDPDAPVDGSCGGFPVGEVLVSVDESFGFGIVFGNDASESVTFTATMLENDIFGDEHTLLDRTVPGGGIGASVQTHLAPEVEGADTMTIQLTSDATGSTILGECSTFLRVGDDSDGDGLLDDWETAGIDTNDDGSSDVFLDPMRKDILLELDYVAGQAPGREDIRAMKRAFAAAPVPNPDGSTGITLWVDTGDLVDPSVSEGTAEGSCLDGVDNGADGLTDASDPDCTNAPGSRHYLETAVEDPGISDCGDGLDNDGDRLVDEFDPGCLVGDDLGGGNAVTRSVGCLDTSFYNTKAANFDGDPLMFHYGVSGHPGDSNPCGGGRGEIGGNDFIEFNHDGGTVLHELGHNLNLRHGGNENDHCKPNYVSAMNYDNQFGIRRVGGGAILDFSPPRVALDGSTRGMAQLPDLVEDSLREDVVLDPNDNANMFVFVDGAGNKTPWPLNSDTDGDGTPDGVNWNGDTDPPFETDTVTVNIDTSDATTGRPGRCTNTTILDDTDPLTGHDDWGALTLNFRTFGDAADGAINPSEDPEPTFEELQELERTINATDLSIGLADTPDPVAAGAPLTYTAVVNNHGPIPAASVQVVIDLPEDVTYASDDGDCRQGPVGTLTCPLGRVGAGVMSSITVDTAVASGVVADAGHPVTITAAAAVENLVADDREPADNATTEDTSVIASADLGLELVHTDLPHSMLLDETGDLTVVKQATNDGPSSPVDAVVDGTAAASAGATIRPTTTSTSVQELATAAPRRIEESFTIGCVEPGIHRFAVTNVISPANASDDDPNSSNNTVEVENSVDCVVPVAINIAPGGSPNAINLRSDSVPVAILTTAVAEYDLPVVFDATTVNPLSVRFGPPDVLAGGDGTTEIHDAGHVEDSRERDGSQETVQDGDDDMVMHFDAMDSGLRPGDTVACVSGEYVDAETGLEFRFFGCDSVRVVGAGR